MAASTARGQALALEHQTLCPKGAKGKRMGSKMHRRKVWLSTLALLVWASEHRELPMAGPFLRVLISGRSDMNFLVHSVKSL